MPNPQNNDLYLLYKKMADEELGVGTSLVARARNPCSPPFRLPCREHSRCPLAAFVGRLASYKYFNMDQAILNALEMFDNLKETGRLAPTRSPVDFAAGDGPK